MARRADVRILAAETKHSSRTTEFYAYIAATIGVLVAGLVTKAGDGHDDRLTAADTWLIVGILTAGYMVSRGLAKAGNAAPWEEGEPATDAEGARFDR
ncbi:MAG: sle [Conexibacter sp.]|nr:sle [Conexibacter sp.]